MHGTIDIFTRKQWEPPPPARVPLVFYAALGMAVFAGAIVGMRFIGKTVRSYDETPRALLPSPARRRTKIDRWSAY